MREIRTPTSAEDARGLSGAPLPDLNPCSALGQRLDRRMIPEFMPRPPELKPIRAGEEISVQVEGGFARKRAPSDGVIVSLPDRDVFVPADDLLTALRAIGRYPT